MAMSVREIKEWLATLPEDNRVGIDKGGLCLLVVEDSEPWLEIGGMPEEDEESAQCPA